jgi:citrate synthase
MTDVKLDHPGGQLSMAVREAVEGPGGIDVSALLKETGFVTLDQGFVNTAAFRSSSSPRNRRSSKSRTC